MIDALWSFVTAGRAPVDQAGAREAILETLRRCPELTAAQIGWLSQLRGSPRQALASLESEGVVTCHAGRYTLAGGGAEG